MSRWWRAYDDAINDPKLLKLSDELHRAWFTLLCIASKHDGVLPPAADIAVMLRVKPAKVAEWITKLTAAVLLDKTETGFAPHNWNGRQYKSDVSTERVKQFRKRKRNVSSDVSETPPETEQITETETDQKSERDARVRSIPSELPEGFQLADADIDAAHSAGMTDATIDAELKIFIARKLSDGKKSANWSAEWLIWCTRWKSMKPMQAVDGPAVDLRSLDFEKQLGRFKRGLPWNPQHWGPEPGQSGCLAPPELLVKHGFTQH